MNISCNIYICKWILSVMLIDGFKSWCFFWNRYVIFEVYEPYWAIVVFAHPVYFPPPPRYIISVTWEKDLEISEDGHDSVTLFVNTHLEYGYVVVSGTLRDCTHDTN